MGSAESGGGRANGSLVGGVATGGLIYAGFSATSPAYFAGGATVFPPRGRDTVPRCWNPARSSRNAPRSTVSVSGTCCTRTGRGSGQDGAAAILPLRSVRPRPGHDHSAEPFHGRTGPRACDRCRD